MVWVDIPGKEVLSIDICWRVRWGNHLDRSGSAYLIGVVVEMGGGTMRRTRTGFSIDIDKL